MKLTEDMFYDWTDKGKDLEFDDELIIEHDPKISSKSITKQILENQRLRELIEEELESGYFMEWSRQKLQSLLDKAKQ